MCKIAGVSGVTKDNRDDVWLLMIALGDLMSPGNDDGLGYAAFDSKGDLFGERWLINSTWYRNLQKDKKIKPNVLQHIYNSFGEKVSRDDITSMILHTRAATNTKGLLNTHPFIDNFEGNKPTTAVIHNGMINNHMQLTKKYSTCDSETIVHEYMERGANLDVTQLGEVVKRLHGWYTCMVMAKDVEKKPVIDVFSDNGRLASVKLPDLDVTVYSSVAEDIMRACLLLGYKTGKPLHMQADTFFRLDGVSGEVTHEGELPTKKFSTGGSGAGTGDGVGDVCMASGNFDDDGFFANWLGERGYRGGRHEH